MKRILFHLFFTAISAGIFAQQNEFELKVTLKPFKNEMIYLAYYYGSQKPIVDSVMLDNNSTAIFKRAKKLEKGIYLIGYPGKAGFFEVLVDKEQKFSVSADTTDILGTVKFQGSPDNDLFLQYQKDMNAKSMVIMQLKTQLSSAKTATDSSKIVEQINKLDEEIKQYRKNLIATNPDATISVLLNAMKEPTVPAALENPKNKDDSLLAYRYYKDHYWDDTWFFDERLVRTTFFEEKLDKYYDQLIYPDPDSVIKEMDWMLAYATASDEMQRFLLIKFVNRYLNPKYMWEDKVFVHLFEKYFSQKEYPWLNEKGKKTIFDRAYSMMANLYGSKASNIELPDSTGKIKSLYSVNSPFTVVIFWDPVCGHCKETLPKIDSIYRAKWKAQGVALYAVAKETDGTRKDWLKFTGDHHLTGWNLVYYSKEENDKRINNNVPGYYQLYDVQSVPTLYLLDKDKLIIAKKIPFDQIDKVLDFKLSKG